MKKQVSATRTTQQELFDPHNELDLVREAIRCGRPRSRRSKLDRYRCDLLDLRAAGATYGEMAAWYRQQTGDPAASSTVFRSFRRWSGGGRVD